MPHQAAPPITVSQAHTRSGVPRRTLQRAIADGQLPARKTGGQTASYLIEQSDLDDYLATRTRQAS